MKVDTRKCLHNHAWINTAFVPYHKYGTVPTLGSRQSVERGNRTIADTMVPR